MDQPDSFGHRPELRFCLVSDPSNAHSDSRLTKFYTTPEPLEQHDGLCGWSRKVVTAPAGTGVYFTNYFYNNTYSSLHNLFLLASVSCEAESILSRHRQLARKRRTPRSFKIINVNRFANPTSRELPSAGGKRQHMESILNICAPPPPIDHGAAAVPSHFSFDNSREIKTLNGKPKMMIPKFCQPVTGKSIVQMAVPINRLVKGSGTIRIPSSKRATKVPKRLARQETRVQRVSKRILQFVGEGSTAEKFIRGALGNNPDTSKALRLLLTENKLKRVGVGGRGKAFLYAATTAGLRDLEELKQINPDNSTINEVPFTLEF